MKEKTFFVEYTGNRFGNPMSKKLIGQTFEVYVKDDRYCTVDNKKGNWSFHKYNVRVISTFSELPEELFEI